MFPHSARWFSFPGWFLFPRHSVFRGVVAATTSLSLLPFAISWSTAPAARGQSLEVRNNEHNSTHIVDCSPQQHFAGHGFMERPTPLHSTRGDVERVLGAPTEACTELCHYETKTEKVF